MTSTSSTPNDRVREPALTGPFGRRAIRLGRVFDIDVGLDWSWVFVFLLVTFTLAQGFAAGNDGWTPVQAWSGAILASVLFFVSILLHEFGHSLTSAALGLPVISITLFIFGGLARLSGEPKRPRDEFLIAVAGPAVSVVLGLGFLLLSFVLPEGQGAMAVFGVVCGWLGSTNLILAVFNVVPGFPLDGGRMLRAVVWHFTGSFERATVAAAGVGSLFAYFLIGTGIYAGLFGGALPNGLWLVFIGWFLLSAAKGSATQVVLQRQLGQIPLAPSVTPLEPMVSEQTSVAVAIEAVVLSQGCRTFFVRDDSGPTGMVTLHELKQVPNEARNITRVGEIMLTVQQLVTIPFEESLWKALEVMNEASVNQLPVEKDGRLVGVLTRERLFGIIQNVRELS